MLSANPMLTAPMDRPALSARLRRPPNRMITAAASGSSSTINGRALRVAASIYSFIEVRSVTSLVWRLR